MWHQGSIRCHNTAIIFNWVHRLPIDLTTFRTRTRRPSWFISAPELAFRCPGSECNKITISVERNLIFDHRRRSRGTSISSYQFADFQFAQPSASPWGDISVATEKIDGPGNLEKFRNAPRMKCFLLLLRPKLRQHLTSPFGHLSTTNGTSVSAELCTGQLALVEITQ